MFSVLHSLVTVSRVFTDCSWILSNVCLGFHQAMKARRTCFISFTKLLFTDSTKRKTVYEARVYSLISFMKLKFSQLGESQPYRSHFVFQCAMKTQVLTNQNARTIQINILNCVRWKSWQLLTVSLSTSRYKVSLNNW